MKLETRTELQWLVDEADAYAEKAHVEWDDKLQKYVPQMRKKSDTPFIVHPRRVAQAVAPYVSPAAVAAALLHDVIEDTLVCGLEGFPARVGYIVDLLTKRDGEDKFAAINKVTDSFDDEVILIKVADRIDNLTDGATTFGKKWLNKYLGHSWILHGGACNAGLRDHPLVEKLKLLIETLQKTLEPTQAAQ